MPTMKAMQVSKKGGPLELVERPIPEPGAGFVRLRVQACGICHSDMYAIEGLFPGTAFPRIPGHELVGVVDAVGAGVSRWKPGQRVGAGWHGGECRCCDPCRRGNTFACGSAPITGITVDGGYAEYVLVKESGLAAVPDALSAIEAGPLMCAGLTTYNALRNSGARGGDIVAVLGLGGLGHLGVQFAAKLGFHTVAIARGADKAPLAKQLGAAHYIDSQASNPASELQKLGGAAVVLATVTAGDAMTATLAGLAPNGTLMVLGAPPSLEASAGLLIGGRRAIKGWYSGVSVDAEDTLRFAAQTGVRSMNEVYPLAKAQEAYERMMSGKARFRVVLEVQ